MRAPIIVGMDGSEHMRRVLGWAAEEARLRGLPIRLVHASLLLTRDGSLTEEGYQRLYDDRTRMLEEAAKGLSELSPGTEVTTRLLEEEPGRALVAEGDDASMSVVGTRGTGGFQGLLFGSVGLHVAGHARCPVMVVPHTAPPAPAAPGRVVIGVDERHAESRAIGWAVEEAERRGAGLTAIHGVGGEFGAPRQKIGEEMLLAEALAGRTSDHPDLPIERVVAPDTPAHALVEASGAAAIVVVGARRRHAHLGMTLGRVNHAVLHHARCPVVIVPE
jgi:nucleotide-binding universal stress UspA family protein